MLFARLWLDGSLRLGKAQFSPRQTAALLDAVDEERSIRAAAERLELSYRSVWGRLGQLHDAVGKPLVAKTKGHGSALTAEGRTFRDALRSAADKLEATLREEGRLLEERLSKLVADEVVPYRIACSHDPTLMSVLAGLDALEISVVGSAEAIERLRSGRADAAGFHLCPGPDGREVLPPGLDGPEFTLRPLLRREQGLMFAAENPLRIASVADLTRPDVTFINRQKGSGTRGWTDWLLARERVPASAVRGYATEEFTHHAVAATVAAGKANVGIGVRAAAEAFGLGFRPLGEETYYLATRRPDANPILAAVLEACGAGAPAGS